MADSGAVRREKKLARKVQQSENISYTRALNFVIEAAKELATEQDTNYAHALSLLEDKWNLK